MRRILFLGLLSLFCAAVLCGCKTCKEPIKSAKKVEAPALLVQIANECRAA